ncbi:MAG: hypothetical protein A2Z95_08815 [Gallionellales bacterium GWA2_60_18]|nr:MAG: hypothetical protein A2Z95_08815 [Gallionellales bacterium GWA2_60_18]
MNRPALTNFIVIVLLACAALAGCSQNAAPGTAMQARLIDIHEHLSYAIRKAGYDHSIMSRREGPVNIDSIFISMPLDGVKRQHPSVEKLLNSIGTICARPEYADVALHIELDASDYDNFLFMRGVLEKALGARTNARIIANQNPRNTITVTLTHHPFGKLP